MGGVGRRGISPFLGLGALSINIQPRSQAKGLFKWQWLPVSQHCREELGNKQNVLECVGGRQVVMTGHLSQACSLLWVLWLQG